VKVNQEYFENIVFFEMESWKLINYSCATLVLQYIVEWLVYRATFGWIIWPCEVTFHNVYII
jgi:hypothetical protein